MNYRSFALYILAITVGLLFFIKSCNSQQPTRIGTPHASAIANCLFCKIVGGNEPAKIVAENADIIAFESIRPRYPTHLLIVPKKHIQDLKSAQPGDTPLLGKLLAAAGVLGKQLNGAQAFNVAINEGAQAGQTVFHLHLHFYSQNNLSSNPKI